MGIAYPWIRLVIPWIHIESNPDFKRFAWVVDHFQKIWAVFTNPTIPHKSLCHITKQILKNPDSRVQTPYKSLNLNYYVSIEMSALFLCVHVWCKKEGKPILLKPVSFEVQLFKQYLLHNGFKTLDWMSKPVHEHLLKIKIKFYQKSKNVIRGLQTLSTFSKKVQSNLT